MPTVKAPPKGEFAKADQGKTRIAGYDDKLVVPDDKTLQQKGGDLSIYADLLRDDQVHSTFQQRRLAVTSKEWQVEPASESAIDKEAAEFIRQQLQAIRWDDVTDKALYSVFFGYGVGEIMWQRQDNRIGIEAIKFRDRARFKFGESGRLYLKRTGGTGLDLMPDRKFWTLKMGGDHDDQLYGVGLAQKLYWPVFFKRNDIKFWLVFLERYSGPTSIGKMPFGQWQDEKARKQVLETLQNLATESAAVIPEGTSVDFLESIYSGSADYRDMHKAMDAAISKIVLSQTMTTDDGSSRSQSETHKDVRDEVVKADADFVCESFNRTVVRWLIELNFPNAGLPRVWRDVEPPEDLNTRADRDEKIAKLGFEPTEDYIKETYGEGWVKKEAQPLRVPGSDTGALFDDPDASFAELSSLTASKNAHRADQQALVEAAQKFARQYQDNMGAQVRQLLEYLEESEDLETFRTRIGEILEQAPPAKHVEKIQRAGLVARLMGRLRGGS